MSTIRIRRKIENETITLPELRPLIGRTVEIIVRDEADADALRTAGDEFWDPPTLEEIARRQGTDSGPPAAFDELKGSFTEADFEGFDEWLDRMRRGED